MNKAFRSLEKANVALANAYATSRNIPHNGQLAIAIQNARGAEQLLGNWAKQDTADRLALYGPSQPVNDPNAQSPLTWDYEEEWQE